MGRWRCHAAALTLGLALVATPLSAITVSDMRALSAAGEPLELIIELADLAGIPEQDIAISVAPAIEHQRLGMTRPAWLEQLSFQVSHDAQGQVIVRATGAQPPEGERVSFLVQIAWPGHVRMQQISATLRQPGEVAQAATVIAPPSLPAAAEPAGGVVMDTGAPVQTIQTGSGTTVIAATGATVAAPASAPVPVTTTTIAAGQPLEVQPGDTLSRLAESWDANDLSLAQRQQLIAQANPQAFIGGDINRLRVGARLALPATTSAPSARAASTWLREQQSRPLSRPAVVAASGAEQPGAGRAGDNEVTLTLLAPAQGDQGRAAGEGDAAARGEDLKTREALAAAEDKRAGLLAEREALALRLRELNEQSAEQDARLKVLDERLAALNTPAAASGKAGDKPRSGELFGISGEVWVWIVFATMLAIFVLIRLREKDDWKPAVKPEEPAPTYAEFHDDGDFQPLPENAAALAWADGPEGAPGDDDEYDFLTDSEAEAHQTRLDLAQAYIEMKETQSARELLNMVRQGGTAEQRRVAAGLLQSLA